MIPASARSGLILYLATNVLTRGALGTLGIVAAGDIGLSPAATGALVATGVLAMRFGRLFVAPFSHAGTRTTVVIGNLLSALGLLGLAAGPTFPAAAWCGVVVLGIGYGAVVLAIKVQLVGETNSPAARLDVLSQLAIALNLGAAIGPTAAGLSLDQVGSTRSFVAAATLAAASAGLAGLMTPQDFAPSDRFKLAALRRAGDPAVAVALVSVALAFAFYAQLANVLPIVVSSSIGVAYVGLVFVTNAVIVVIAQVPLSRLIGRSPTMERHAGPIGMILFAVGFAALAISTDIGGLSISIIAISLAECLVLPFVERELAERLRDDGLVVAFTLSAAAMGIGETVGSLVGVQAALSSSGAFSSLMLALSIGAVVSALAVSVLILRHSYELKGSSS